MADAHQAIKDVPLPRRMLGIRRDKRGYPIPYLMMDTQIHIDMEKQAECMLKRLCMICGKRLDNKKWFIGGHAAAKNRLFSDLAMHEECARYSLRVCPFLSNSDMKYRKKYDDDTIFYAGHIPGTAKERSPTQMLMRTNGYRMCRWRDMLYVLANRWDYVEHWSYGKQVEGAEHMSAQGLLEQVGLFDEDMGMYYDQLEFLR